MKDSIIVMNKFYASKGMGAIQQIKYSNENPDIAIYGGIKNPGVPILFAAINIKSDCSMAEFYDLLLEDIFKMLSDFADCYGKAFILFHNQDNDTWFKVGFNTIRTLRVNNRNNSKEILSIKPKQIRITAEGPDYLEKVKFPFSAVKKKDYILPGIENPFI